GANINTQAKDGFTALHYVAKNGNIDAATFLLAKGAKHSDAEFVLFERSLYGAAKIGKKWGSLGVFAMLGSLASSNMSQGWKPIHLAARQGNIAMVTFLRANGEAATSETSDKLTPLHLASISGAVPVLEELTQDNPTGLLTWERLCINSKRNFINYLGNTSIYAIMSGCDLNGQDKNGWTPLHWAHFYQRKDAIKWLENNGADITAKTTSDVKITEDIVLNSDLEPSQLDGVLPRAKEIATTPGVGTTGGAQFYLWR
ncbi:MAG: ankyrin repeat domain-containing protein, partial [Bacteroidota bacterium]